MERREYRVNRNFITIVFFCIIFLRIMSYRASSKLFLYLNDRVRNYNHAFANDILKIKETIEKDEKKEIRDRRCRSN